MFWKLMLIALVVWAAGMYFSVTLGGLIHLLPAGALAGAVGRRMSRDPDSEFGRWRPHNSRDPR